MCANVHLSYRGWREWVLTSALMWTEIEKITWSDLSGISALGSSINTHVHTDIDASFYIYPTFASCGPVSVYQTLEAGYRGWFTCQNECVINFWMRSNFQCTQRVKWVGFQLGSSSAPPYVQEDKPSAAARGKVNMQKWHILGCY